MVCFLVASFGVFLLGLCMLIANFESGGAANAAPLEVMVVVMVMFMVRVMVMDTVMKMVMILYSKH